MVVRNATHLDTGYLAGLVADFYAEAPYHAPAINPDKTMAALDAVIAAQNDGNPDAFARVMDKDGQPQGMIIAERVPDIWSDALVVVEHFLYVRSVFRGSLSAGRMVRSFKEWAESAPGVIRAQASSGLNDEGVQQLYQKLGWSERGRVYGMEML